MIFYYAGSLLRTAYVSVASTAATPETPRDAPLDYSCRHWRFLFDPRRSRTHFTDGATTLTAERYRDGSVRVDYLYDDPYEEAVQLQCVLMTEVDVSSANLAYNIEWAALKAANQFVNTDIELRTENSKFQWGDRSTFAIQESEGEGNGFAFVSRKGRRVFFIDCWGLPIEDSAELSDILLPHLEKFALEQF